MGATTATGRARLNVADLGELDESLIDAGYGAIPGLSTVLGEGAGTEQVSETRKEIIGVYREGVEIASSVEVFPLVALLQSSGQPIPPMVQVAASNYAFHLLAFVFALKLPVHTLPAEAEFAVDFTPSQLPGQESPRSVKFFPPEIRETVLKLATNVEVGLTGALDFAVPDEVAAITGLSEASVKAKAGGTFVLGPFRYELRKASIIADGLNQPRVQWRYMLASELAGSSEFQSWVILKSPKVVTPLKMSLQLGVLPYKREWGLFRKYLKVMRDTRLLEVQV